MTCIRWRYPDPDTWAVIAARMEQRKDPGLDVVGVVREILARVRAEGDAALAEYTARFDCPGFTPAMLEVPAQALTAALDTDDATFQADMDIIKEAATNIRAYHQAQVQQSWWRPHADGSITGQLVRPVDRVGLYVPGGQGGETPLISSLLMNAIPAQVAGVAQLAVVSPPRKDGTLNPYILATAALLGIDEVYATGSAWAVAALAYGTQSIRPVDVIVGPGNLYVATAKQLLIGEIGIDMIAGPSEICIIADDIPGRDLARRARWLAADMLSQAEHDALAAAVCISPSAALLDAVCAELERQCQALPRHDIAARCLADFGALVQVPDLDTAAELSNRFAPEHLELAVADPWALMGRIRHAGAIFLGDHTPEPVGDYFAGPNHVLPTLGTARFASALGVDNFCKKSSVIATSPGFLQAHGDKIARFARLEGLEAHARAVECRKDQPS
ncbi:MAG: histidinol dehydrogenase [Desulfovibrio sp.]|nr:histidinol dehydrogenase [Desulfovibrio sp.]